MEKPTGNHRVFVFHHGFYHEIRRVFQICRPNRWSPPEEVANEVMKQLSCSKISCASSVFAKATLPRHFDAGRAGRWPGMAMTREGLGIGAKIWCLEINSILRRMRPDLWSVSGPSVVEAMGFLLIAIAWLYKKGSTQMTSIDSIHPRMEHWNPWTRCK